MSDASQDDDDDDDVGDDGSLADKSASSFSSASFKVNRPLSDALHRRQQVGEKTLTAEGGVRGGGGGRMPHCHLLAALHTVQSAMLFVYILLAGYLSFV